MSENQRVKIQVKDIDDPLVYYRLSPEEQRALQECDRESFYQRCLPIMTFLTGSTFLAVHQGILRPNSRFGAAPKMTIAMIFGYILGKLSYQQKCAEKLMSIPNSYIGQQLKLRQQGRLSQSKNINASQIPMLGVKPSDIYSDAGPGSSLNMDTDRPDFNSDTYNRPKKPVAEERPVISYDEMRRRNRAEFFEKKREEESQRRIREQNPGLSQPEARNDYGDRLE